MLKFIYIEKKFKLKKSTPVSGKEYERLKGDYKIIIDVFEERHQECLQEFKEIYTYKKRLTVLGVSLVCCVFVFLIEKAKIISPPGLYYLYVIYAATAAIIIHSLIYLASFILSLKDQYVYKTKFKSYYKYHYKMISETTSYSNYINRLNIRKSLLS